MAVSTNSITNDTDTTTTTATATATATAKKNIKMEPMLFEELFSTIGADVPSSHLVPSTSGANSMDAQTMLDEWLANDLQQTGMFTEVTEVAEAPSLFSSPSVDGTPESSFLGDSPLVPTLAGDFELAAQPLFDSPLLGDISPMLSSPSCSFTSPPNDVFANSPVLDSDPAVGNFFPDLHPTPTSQSSKSKAESPTPTAALVAQLAAAGAFNIPWGTEPAAQQVPLHPVDPLQQAAAIAAAQAAAAEFRLAQANATANPSNNHPAGIQYPSKRKTVDLEEVDPNDEVALKRAKNTDAARRSRMKKLLKMEGLERRVAEVEGENSKLVLRVAVLESEKVGGEAREHEYERRIKRLEEQLREAHKAMLDSRSSKE